MKKLFLVAATVALLAWPAKVQAQKRDVDVKAADGTLLKATYFSAGKPGPGIILLHMCNSQRKAWDKLGAMLAARGIHVMTMDYRGYGESGGRPFRELSDQERVQISREVWPGDIRTVFANLLSQPGVDRARIGAGGGSCGVDNAIRLAMRQPEVKTLVLLAGGTGRDGQEYLAESAWLPVFGAAAEDDGSAVGDMRWLLGFSSHSANRMKVYANGGHGTDIFPVHKDLEPMVADWFEQHLVKAPVAGSTAIGPPGPSARLIHDLRRPGGGARALAQLREARKAGAALAAASEGAINALGYEHSQAGRHADAIDLFLLNVEAYPNSCNTYDSLSDGYLAAGDRAKALEFAQKALDAISRDTTTPDAFKQQVRQSAEGKVRQLSAPVTPAR